MIIGLMGLEFGSENLGCSALSFSFINILKNIEKEKKSHFDKIVIFMQEKNNRQIDIDTKKIDVVYYSFRNFSSILELIKKIKNCSYIFDFTQGDSFADIYGLKRFIKTFIVKSFVCKFSNLILAPQTYGPFNTFFAKKCAKMILELSKYIFARDKQSLNCVKSLSNCKVSETIDIAFSLPYISSTKFSETTKTSIGINVSGLLWNGGYNKNNQFNLNVNYRKYCLAIVSWLLDNNYSVILISHVNSDKFPIENDMNACRELNLSLKNKCTIAPYFGTPSEAKSYISRLDCFIGARMHATIAALSSCVPVIPFSYSRKFNGLYSSLDYPYIIDGKKLSTEEAISQTKEYIQNLKNLQNNIFISNELAQEKLKVFTDFVSVLLTRAQNTNKVNLR